MTPLVKAARRAASKCLLPIARRAAKAYVAGERLEDALAVAGRLHSQRLGCTLGYWDAAEDSPRAIVDHYLAAIRALSQTRLGYLSIKVPTLGYDDALFGEVVHAAATAGVRLHFDALGPEAVDPSRELFDRFSGAGAELSFTLPGRWVRSLRDADWVAQRGIIVRVVKGQWKDPEAPGRDLRSGYLEVVDRLAGRARHVALASHDAPLVAEAVRRLRAAGTAVSLELLYGLPMRPSLESARELGLDVAVYVSYGKAYLPYAMSRLLSHPQMMLWLARDLFSGGKSR